MEYIFFDGISFRLIDLCGCKRWPRPCCIDFATARSMLQCLSLRFSRRHLTRDKSPYPNSNSIAADLLPADEPREPGAELREEGLGTRWGMLMCWRESFILSMSLAASSLLCVLLFDTDESRRSLFGRVERWLLEADGRLRNGGGSLTLWPVRKK